MERVVLEAGPYTLRPPEPPDVSWIYDACQDPDIQRWTRVPRPYAAADAVSFLNSATKGWADGTHYPFLIAATETGELLGACGVHAAEGTGPREIGFWLAVDGRGRGVLTHALPGLLKWCRRTIGLEEVIAFVLEGNEASERLLRRVGFELITRDAMCTSPRRQDRASSWRKNL